MRILIAIAARYLVARYRQSLLTVGGIVVGVMALSIIQAIMGGFRAQFVKNTLGNNPHITVRKRPPQARDPVAPARSLLEAARDPVMVTVRHPPLPDEPERIANAPALEARLREVPGVAATAPSVAGTAMFGFSGLWEPVNLTGIIPSAQSRVVEFAARVKEGSAEALERDQNGVILGNLLARRMRVGIGDRVFALAGDGSAVPLRIVGLYSSLVFDTDDAGAWVNLRRAQALLGMSGVVNSIQVRTTDYERADEVADRIQWALGMEAESWSRANRNTLNLLTMIVTIQYVIAAFTMTVAGFGIAGNLITTVGEKTFDIGVLKAMGMRAEAVAVVFLALAAMMMALGVLIGLGMAYFVVEWLGTLPSAAQPQPGVFAASDRFPVAQYPLNYLFSGVFAMVVSLAAGYSPARRAARLQPLTIIRGAG